MKHLLFTQFLLLISLQAFCSSDVITVDLPPSGTEKVAADGSLPGVNFQLTSEHLLSCHDLETETCTATAVKVDGTCALLTNNHCVISDVAKVILPNGSTHSLHVTKRGGCVDIAQLEMPPEFDAVCKALKDTSSKTRIINFASLMTIGYQKGHLSPHFSGDIGWDQGAYGMSNESIYPLSRNVNDVLVKLTNIDIFPGMSGGYVVDTYGNFIGLHSQYAPFESTAYVIPPSTINAFLKSNASTAQACVNSPKNDLLPTGGNGHSDPGGNGHSDPGGNGHSDPGGNGHSDPGGNGHSDPGLGSSTYPNPLILAQEPLEGYPLPDGRVLLAADQTQIDGQDDYLKIYNPGTPEKRLVTRPQDGYPNESVMKGLFHRLQGSYGALITQATPSEDAIYMKDPQSDGGWKKLMAGTPVSSLTIDESKHEIVLDIPPHILQAPSANILNPGGINIRDQEIHFKWTMSPDGKTIQLTGIEPKVANSQPTIFNCDNRNYLKLICQSPDGIIFSISAERAGGEISYRFGRKSLVRDQEVFNFRYGEMLRMKDDP